ncbi:hypothetical protein VFPFJ_05334 [Purpureocillium lilacinum]|uniref:Uncharacterized protein n=1 Tax=Purpureocillium lilacinum TaxID=33203 RepID=A0A179H2B4_PURLI|nr:hypothetical protein VFPFJ_05334 [Purpureocillium lilacinum]OAQ84385.1 hypothetical protein VFPBJ_03153 [Purpureocillium lilacinum]OAQ91175.1 hypothetical protein VFPFJ_05334 [Purpureocillium lilacinum]
MHIPALSSPPGRPCASRAKEFLFAACVAWKLPSSRSTFPLRFLTFSQPD